MNRILLRCSAPALIFVTVTGLVAICAEEGTTTESSIERDVARIRPLEFTLAVREFSGGLTEENVHKQITTVVNEFTRQGLDFELGEFTPKPFLILYDDPDGKETIRAWVGISIPQRAEIRAPLKLERVRFENAVRHIHKGPHKELGAVYRQIGEAVKRTRKGQSVSFPVVLQILDDPTRFKAEDVRTVLNVPVK